MTQVRKSFNAVPMAANSSYEIRGSHMGGFLAKTGGTITVVSKDALGTSDVTLVDAVPLTAGLFTEIPINFPAINGIVTLGGGASGTLMV